MNFLQNGGLGCNEAVLWYDWAQGWSLPQAHEELNTMFYGTARMPLSLFGCVLLQKLGDGSIRRKNLAIVTDGLSIVLYTLLSNSELPFGFVRDYAPGAYLLCFTRF